MSNQAKTSFSTLRFAAGRGHMLLSGPQISFAPEDFSAAAPESDSLPAPSDEPSIESIIAFDPFAPSGGPTPAPAAQEPAPAGSEPLPAASPEPAPALDSSVQQLLDRQTQIMERLAAPTPDSAPPAPAAPRFALTMPPELVAGIRSDDPGEAATALNILVNGIATVAFNEAMKEMASFRAEIPQQFHTYTTLQTEQRRISDDFYGSYPDLDKPLLKPVVLEAAKQVAMEMGSGWTGWNDDVKKRVAERVIAAVGFTPTPAAPPPQQFTPRGGARPTPQPKNDILDTLGF